MNIEDLPSFFSERGEDCLFVDGSLDSEYLQKIAIVKDI
jgi:ATP-dependent DNA helicase DinG